MLQINPGEVWLTRDGKKARIYAVDGRGSRPIHGAVSDGDEDDVVAWTATGQYWSRPGTESDHDLIRKYDWREELKPIWALLKPKYKLFAFDVCMNGWVYRTRPVLEETSYYSQGAQWVGHFVLPKPDCPWYETLTERP
jgi:hypothetical protein